MTQEGRTQEKGSRGCLLGVGAEWGKMLRSGSWSGQRRLTGEKGRGGLHLVMVAEEMVAEDHEKGFSTCPQLSPKEPTLAVSQKMGLRAEQSGPSPGGAGGSEVCFVGGRL